MTPTIYEHPLNEKIRTLLRLDHLLRRLWRLRSQGTGDDQHFFFLTLFEAGDVSSRQDLKRDLLKELERNRHQLQGLQSNPRVDTEQLRSVVDQMETAFTDLSQQSSKSIQLITENDWLNSLRSRMSVPGAACEFDLPAYFAWQQLDHSTRLAQMHEWTKVFDPLRAAVNALLDFLRESAEWQKNVAKDGQFQLPLGGRVHQLVRLRMTGNFGYPEVMGHRLMIGIRFMRLDSGNKAVRYEQDINFDLALC